MMQQLRNLSEAENQAEMKRRVILPAECSCTNWESRFNCKRNCRSIKWDLFIINSYPKLCLYIVQPCINLCELEWQYVKLQNSYQTLSYWRSLQCTASSKQIWLLINAYHSFEISTKIWEEQLTNITSVEVNGLKIAVRRQSFSKQRRETGES